MSGTKVEEFAFEQKAEDEKNEEIAVKQIEPEILVKVPDLSEKDDSEAIVEEETENIVKVLRLLNKWNLKSQFK